MRSDFLKSFVLLLVLSLVVALVGCGPNPKKQVVGNWTVSTDKSVLEAPGKPAMSPQVKQAVIKILSKVKLTINDDGTYSADQGASPDKGTWVIKDRTVTFHSTMDQKGKDQDVLLSDDGSTLTMSVPGGVTLVFIKAASSS